MLANINDICRNVEPATKHVLRFNQKQFIAQLEIFFFFYWTYQTLQEASRAGDDDEDLPH